MRRLLLGITAGLALCAAAIGVAGYVAWQRLEAPLELPREGLRFEVEPGTPLARVTRDLADLGVLGSPKLVEWLGRLRGDATGLHAGEYELRPGLTPRGLLDKLVRGEVYLHQLTVIEGWRFQDLLASLRANPAVAASERTPQEIMTALGMPDTHPEGQFLPDTYVFPKGTGELEILGWAHAALERKLEAAWAGRSADTVLETPYEALILASIVEKETALASERRLISGVFQERLKRGMRLQTDPTVIYGLGAGFDGNLRRRDLDADTPYNTYTRRGLPPTPIALPSAASIEAATNPEMTGALYFVATGLPDRSHRFSRTLEEHNRAVREFLDRQREQRAAQ